MAHLDAPPQSSVQSLNQSSNQSSNSVKQTSSAHKSQSKLLAGVVRTKRQKSKEETVRGVGVLAKKPKSLNPGAVQDCVQDNDKTATSPVKRTTDCEKEDCENSSQTMKSSTLSGLCVYSDSDSENED